jgi:RHS repeat-associated protein
MYNGKEFNDDVDFDLNWYDYGARFYDPQLARWHSVDPHAENYLSISPYAYVGNNPIVRIDPDGRDWYEDKEGKMIFDPKLSKDNHETYMQENGIEGKYWGSTGFSINEESGLSIAYYSDGTSREGLWQLSEVVVEAEMTDHQRIMSNPLVQGIHHMHGQFIDISGQLIETSGNTISQLSYITGFYPGVLFGSGISTIGLAISAISAYSQGENAAGNYAVVAIVLDRVTHGLINKAVPVSGKDRFITRAWYDGTRTVTDKTLGKTVRGR